MLMVVVVVVVLVFVVSHGPPCLSLVPGEAGGGPLLWPPADGMFCLLRIMSTFHPWPPFLRSSSEMGSWPSWPQMPFQLGTPVV